MKKTKILLVSLISIFAFNINVYAASASLSVSSGSVYVGDKFTVTANVISAAAWNVHVSASGPVSGCSINQADSDENASNTNKTFSATCTATGTGTITITLSGDVIADTDDVATSISGSRTVTVTTKPVVHPTTNNNNNNTNTNNTKKEDDNKSKNNNLKSISIDGQKLTKVNNNNYTLSVPNDVTSINVKATAEDSKAKVTGTGNHPIKVGDNNIEIIVTAENGSQNKIILKVTRKDGYYLEDLASVLNNSKLNDINIIIKADSVISASDLEKIKSSKKKVSFNYYDANKLLVYSWIIDGTQLKSTSNLSTAISNNSNNKKDILRLSNYADGMFIVLKQASDFPIGAKLKMYVGNKYEEKDLVNIYAYLKNSDKLNLIQNKASINDGYIEFEITDTSDYFVTMSTVSDSNKSIVDATTTGNSSSPIVLIIIAVTSSLIAFGLAIAFIFKSRQVKKNVVSTNVEPEIPTVNATPVATTTVASTEPVNTNLNSVQTPVQTDNMNNSRVEDTVI